MVRRNFSRDNGLVRLALRALQVCELGVAEGKEAMQKVCAKDLHALLRNKNEGAGLHKRGDDAVKHVIKAEDIQGLTRNCVPQAQGLVLGNGNDEVGGVLAVEQSAHVKNSSSVAGKHAKELEVRGPRLDDTIAAAGEHAAVCHSE